MAAAAITPCWLESAFMWRTLPSEKLITLLPPFLDFRAFSLSARRCNRLAPPAEISLRAIHVAQNLRLQRLRILKLALVPHPAQELHRHLLRRPSLQRREQVGLDRASLSIKGWAVADIR